MKEASMLIKMSFVRIFTIGRLSLIVATLFIVGCESPPPEPTPEEKAAEIQQLVDRANQFLFAGQIDEALSILESADQNNLRVIEMLGFAYAQKLDHALAAFYFDQAIILSPDRTDLALYSAQSHVAIEDWAAASQAYKRYLQDNPTDSLAWKSLAQSEENRKALKPALDAYLQSIKHLKREPNALEHQEVAELFLKLGNTPQAEQWFKKALSLPGKENAHPESLLGLLRINWNQKNWPNADIIVQQLDRISPDALDNSELAFTRPEIKNWRLAQEALEKQKLAAQLKAEEEARKKKEAEALAKKEAEEKAARLAAEIAQAEREALAKMKQAEEANDETVIPPKPLHTSQSTITIDREPTLFEKAKRNRLAGKYAEAISQFRAALAEDPEDAETWFELSRAYFQNEQWNNAELSASEAIRLDSENANYHINFLKAVQKTQGSARFLRELERAKEAFPQNPDITLALAQAYQRIAQNNRNARYLYEEFLELAPQHAQAEKAKETLATLPR